MYGQSKRYFGTFMDMTRALLATSGLPGLFWPLTVYHAICLKNFRCIAMISATVHPTRWFLGYIAYSSHLHIFGSQVQAILPPHECDDEISDRTRARKHVRHDHSGTTCMVREEKTNRHFKRGRAEVSECMDEAQRQMHNSS